MSRKLIIVSIIFNAPFLTAYQCIIQAPFTFPSSALSGGRINEGPRVLASSFTEQWLLIEPKDWFSQATGWSRSETVS